MESQKVIDGKWDRRRDAECDLEREKLGLSRSLKQSNFIAERADTLLLREPAALMQVL